MTYDNAINVRDERNRVTVNSGALLSNNCSLACDEC